DGFEAVDRTPVVLPAPAQAGMRAATIRGHVAKVTRGVAAIKVSCPATSSCNCTGTLVVRTAGRVRIAGRNAALQLGSTRYNLAPGASKTLRVRLARGDRKSTRLNSS